MKDRNHANKLRRKRRLKYGYVYEEKYSKTINGLLVRIYQNMKGRVLGIQKKDYPNLYKGKELLDRHVFYDWAKSDCNFNLLYEKWVLSGYDRKLVPSIDRIDSSMGYILENIRWITFSENCKRSKDVSNRIGLKRSDESIRRQAKTNMEKNRSWYENIETKERFFLSPTEMQRKFGGYASAYTKLKKGKLNKTNGFAHIEIFNSGEFAVHNKQIINGRIL